MTLIGLRIALTDWWRGFTQEDLWSAQRKIDADKGLEPGAVTLLSPREFKAWIAFTRIHVGMGR